MESLYLIFDRKKISSAERVFLETYFPYFRRLPAPHKREFVHKLEQVLTLKKFVGRGELRQVTDEMKLLIGATLVMVTFGWKNFRLSYFHTFLIYPDDYYSTINQTYHRGEVNPRHGLIVLSWKSFVCGLTREDDGINLGIHEMAHALKLVHFILESGERGFDPESWRLYCEVRAGEMAKLSAAENSFFRSRAAADEHEFFAVMLENFFERPHEFFLHHEELYLIAFKLMRQDPRVWLVHRVLRG
ncbi:zinc-dependent peptidase [Algoriphagus jejuensis]|uniref:zinc-dependent peptidase n=1 Tax=Algoriphagus jejuensis TaxID=419934 RepID=UPI0031D70CEA